ncbi:MAG: hypothetical protein PHR06_02500 [Candidatus Cloacimonetes bacterium]|nr:hypothetical protein [Candidatus Cloacimonadota bacterium]
MRSRYRFFEDENALYFITLSIVGFIPIFTNKSYYDILISNMEFYRKRDGLNIFYYVIMDNHLHLIAQSRNLSDSIRDYKKYTAKQILEALHFDKRTWITELLKQLKPESKTKSSHQVWQEGNHPQRISSDRMLNQKIEYIHQNPVKRGFVIDETAWYYSSARNINHLQAPLQVDRLDDFFQSIE